MGRPHADRLSLSGQRFGRLVVQRDDGYRGNSRFWICLCDCGKITRKRSDFLRHRPNPTCGCDRYEKIGSAARTHGMVKSREYASWENMRQRCTNPKATAWRFYGGRGIRVCAAWLGPGGFERFLAHVGMRPAGCSIDRIDYNGHYRPGNVRWIPSAMQHANVRSNRRIVFRGKNLHLTEWARRIGLKPDTLHARLTDLGWSVRRALTQQVR